MPWCIEARGISEGPKESVIEMVLSGAAGSLATGLNRLASATAAEIAVFFHAPRATASSS